MLHNLLINAHRNPDFCFCFLVETKICQPDIRMGIFIDKTMIIYPNYFVKPKWKNEINISSRTVISMLDKNL